MIIFECNNYINYNSYKIAFNIVELLLLTGIPIDLNYRWRPKSQCVGCKVLMMNGDREYK